MPINQIVARQNTSRATDQKKSKFFNGKSLVKKYVELPTIGLIAGYVDPTADPKTYVDEIARQNGYKINWEYSEKYAAYKLVSINDKNGNVIVQETDGKGFHYFVNCRDGIATKIDDEGKIVKILNWTDMSTEGIDKIIIDLVKDFIDPKTISEMTGKPRDNIIKELKEAHGGIGGSSLLISDGLGNQMEKDVSEIKEEKNESAKTDKTQGIVIVYVQSGKIESIKDNGGTIENNTITDHPVGNIPVMDNRIWQQATALVFISHIEPSNILEIQGRVFDRPTQIDMLEVLQKLQEIERKKGIEDVAYEDRSHFETVNPVELAKSPARSATLSMQGEMETQTFFQGAIPRIKRVKGMIFPHGVIMPQPATKNLKPKMENKGPGLVNAPSSKNKPKNMPINVPRSITNQTAKNRKIRATSMGTDKAQDDTAKGAMARTPRLMFTLISNKGGEVSAKPIETIRRADDEEKKKSAKPKGAKAHTKKRRAKKKTINATGKRVAKQTEKKTAKNGWLAGILKRHKAEKMGRLKRREEHKRVLDKLAAKAQRKTVVHVPKTVRPKTLKRHYMDARKNSLKQQKEIGSRAVSNLSEILSRLNTINKGKKSEIGIKKGQKAAAERTIVAKRPVEAFAGLKQKVDAYAKVAQRTKRKGVAKKQGENTSHRAMPSDMAFGASPFGAETLQAREKRWNTRYVRNEWVFEERLRRPIWGKQLKKKKKMKG